MKNSKALANKIEEALHELELAHENNLDDVKIISIESKIDALYEAFNTVYGYQYLSLEERKMFEMEMEEPTDYAYTDNVTMMDLA